MIKRANVRAQRRFHYAFDAGVITDPTADATRLYLEAERLVDRLMAPEEHPTPAAVVAASLGWHGFTVLHREEEGFEAIVNYTSRMDEYQTRGA